MKNNLSEKLKVLPSAKPVTYRLIGAGQKDLLTGKPTFKSGFHMPGTTTIYDPDDKEGNYNKTLRYITGQYTDAQGKVQYQVDGIEWDHTNSMTVRPENYPLYEFLERHNGNTSNPFRDQTKPAVFERVDFEAIAKGRLDAEETEFDAVSLARGMDFDALVDYARSLGVNTNQSASEIRYDMVRKAKGNPAAFVANSNSRMTKTRARLSRAQEDGVIEWNAASRQWKFVREEGPFHVVAPGVNHVEALTDFVLTSKDGELVLKEIDRRLGVTEAAISVATAITAPATAVAGEGTATAATRTAPVRKVKLKAAAAKAKTAKAKAAQETPAPGLAENKGSAEGNEA